MPATDTMTSARLPAEPGWALSRLLGHSLVQNAASLYAVQFTGYIVPLLTIPYLARVLGASGWGRVAFAQAFCSYVALFGEYGFALSATREVARQRHDRQRLGEILSGVLGAKVVLGLAALPVTLVAHYCVPLFREDSTLLWAGMLWAIGQASSMVWFFQGLERMRLAATVDIGGKLAAAAAIFALVRLPADGWRALALWGVGSLLSSLFTLTLAWRKVKPRWPTCNSVRSALAMGWSMFLFRSSVSLYTTGNAFVLGLFVAPNVVGYYTGAEKISKAFLGLLSPVGQALYPRMSHLAQHARAQAAQLARLGLIVLGGGGAVLGLAVFLLARPLVRILLGAEFAPAVPLLRWLALLPPLIALSNVFGIQWMLPLGLDRQFNRIILCAGVLNLVLAAGLAPGYAARGMAWAVISAEFVVTAGAYVVLRTRGLDPMNCPAGAAVRCPAAGARAAAGAEIGELMSRLTHEEVAELLCPVPLLPLPANPLISVLVANYNYDRFIGEAIESVLGQSYANFELLICDDGSTDSSWEVIEAYAHRDPRIRAVRQENGGMAAALNSAYRESRGHILCFLDSDDYYLPEKLATVVTAFRSHPDTGLLMHGLHRVDARGRCRGVMPFLPRCISGWLGPYAFKTAGALPWVAPCSGFCVLREVAQRIFPLPGHFRKNADGVITALATFLTPVLFLDVCLSGYRQHGANITNTAAMTAEWLEEQINVVKSYWNVQRAYLESLSPTLACALVPWSEHESVRQMEYVRARLRRVPDTLTAYRRLMANTGFAASPVLARCFWQVSIVLPRFLFLRALRLAKEQGRLKQQVTRLRSPRPNPLLVSAGCSSYSSSCKRQT